MLAFRLVVEGVVVRIRSVLAALAVLLAASVSAGCAARAAAPSPAVPSAPAPAPVVEAPVRELAMPLAQRGGLPARFPLQVPVIAGSIVSTSSALQADSWLYEVETSGTAVAAARWYVRAYSAADWTVADQKTSMKAGRTVIDAKFGKGAAVSSVHTEELAHGRVRVRADVGIGAPLPQVN
jgi:hypothetical protein